jgi:hypothetical protein
VSPLHAMLLPSVAGKYADDGWGYDGDETTDQKGHQQTLHRTSS